MCFDRHDDDHCPSPSFLSLSQMDGPSMVLHSVVVKPSTTGDARPLLDLPFLLIHGMTSAHQTFLNVLQPLADATHRPVVAVDLRGHGASPEPSSPTAYNLSNMAADVAATLDTLGVARVIVVGHSWGSRVALQFAACFPSRVGAVVVEDEFIRADLSKGPALPRDVFAEKAAALQSKWRPSFPSQEECEVFFVDACGKASSVGLDNYSKKMLHSPQSGQWVPLFKPHVAFAWDEYCRTADMGFIWKNPCGFPFKVHIMCGGDDEGAEVKRAEYDALCREAAEMGCPQLRSVSRIEGALHVVHRSHPEEFVADLIEATTGAK